MGANALPRYPPFALHCEAFFLPGEKPMTREEAINKLKILQGMGDKEIAHCNADDVICDLLKALGYEDVVKEYDEIDKWYA